MYQIPRIPGRHRRSLALGAAGVLAAITLAACGSSSGSGNNSGGAGSGGGNGSTTTQSPTTPSTRFSTASVSGLGTVLVDGRGHTVYILTSSSMKNVPCTSASGCSSVWPALPLPAGANSATASGSAKSSMLSTTTIGGKTYPTYNGYVVYEYSGDSSAGQANGQGIKSFGGTWWVLSPSGTPITTSASGSSGGGGGGGGY